MPSISLMCNNQMKDERNPCLQADAGPTKAASQQKDQRRKDPKLRQKELLGAGGTGLAADLLSTAAVNVSQFLQSATASDVVVELAVGASNGTRLHINMHEPVSTQERL